jgi:hypothetical protein
MATSFGWIVYNSGIHNTNCQHEWRELVALKTTEMGSNADVLVQWGQVEGLDDRAENRLWYFVSLKAAAKTKKRRTGVRHFRLQAMIV